MCTVVGGSQFVLRVIKLVTFWVCCFSWRGLVVCIANSARVCGELLERWDDVSLYFGTHRPTTVTAVRKDSTVLGQGVEATICRAQISLEHQQVNANSFACLLVF